MRPTTVVRALLATGAAIGALALCGSAFAQDSTDPNDALRALVPEGEPGDLDVTQGDAIYKQIAAEVGKSTAVADFGDGSELAGPCGGFAWSYDGDGKLIDAAADLGTDQPPIDLLDNKQAFTSGNPFKVDTRGVVVYYGFAPQTGDGPRDHKWTIKTAGVSLDSGGDTNNEAKNRNAGLVDLGKDLPLTFSFKTKVSGELISQNLAPCTGNGWVEFDGGFPLATVPGIVGSLFLAGGLIGLLFNSRPAVTWKA
jgi:hypothetical protein